MGPFIKKLKRFKGWVSAFDLKKILKSFEVTESSREDEFLHLVKVVDENNFDKIYDNFLQVLFTLFFVDCC